MTATDYTKYGLVQGFISVGMPTTTCGIICGGWPSWAIGAQSRGWKISQIIVKDCTWIKRMTSWFPSAAILHYDQWGPQAHVESVWLSDCDVPRKINMWNNEGVHTVISRRRVRYVPDPQWKMKKLQMCHANCGGVTTGTWDIYLYQREVDLKPDCFEGRATRDLASILDTKAQGRPCLPPDSIVTNEPEEIEIRPGLFHGGGLLPWPFSHHWVIAPAIFSPTGWVKRRLKGSEVMEILDIPSEISQTLNSEEVKILCQDSTTLPIKVVLSVINCVIPMDNNKYQGLLQGSIRNAPREDTAAHLEEQTVGSMGELMVDNPPPADRNAKATKADDAAIPEHLWNDFIFPRGEPQELKALNLLRGAALTWWRRKVTRDFLRWYHNAHKNSKNTKEAQADRRVGVECITRGCSATFWEWDGGSRPFFWRWPEDYRKIIKEGHPLWTRSSLPQWRVPQRQETNPELRKAIKKKLVTVRTKGYIAPGPVISLTSFFSVPKGDSDIRIVYDGTKSGLNNALWAPWFPLPSIDTHLRAVEPGTFMGDLDISEMFLNFMLHPRIQPYAGLDLTPYFDSEDIKQTSVIWERWNRCTMGFKPSPYQSVQGILIAEEVIRGNPKDPSNIFRWDTVCLNLPGSTNYQPGKAWVSKVRQPNGKLACDLFIYVDDVRTTGNEYEECRRASQRVASILNHLGIQDAARKRRDPSQTPGPWAGSIVVTDGVTVEICISQERWDKAKNMIRWMHETMTSGPRIEFKTLERYRGYLVYISRTYPAITPYLKGIHLTLDSWRPWRQDDGWKMTLTEIRIALEEKGGSFHTSMSEIKAPKTVNWVSRFPDDVNALMWLFDNTNPPKRKIRPNVQATAIYKFGDASGAGFGSSLILGDKVYYRHGQWSRDFSEESSNFRELGNLVFSIEEACAAGLLHNAELFMFTDNATAESAFFKGTSKSKKLFELILRLRKLQIETGLIIHVVHVAGTRMMSQGTDGLSRGNTTSGVMQGSNFHSFVPLHLSALERQGSTLKEWVEGWYAPPTTIQWLKPEDWFHHSLQVNYAVWTPPPAAAETALEQLGRVIHKRPTFHHLIICPRLMTSLWRRMLGKICDVVFTVPPGTDCWSTPHGVSEGPPSWIAWRGKCAVCHQLLLPGAGLFCGNFSSKRGIWEPCRRAWCGRCYTALDNKEFPIAYPRDEDGVIQTDEDEKSSRYLVARNGDNLMTPFQCDLCHFRNLMGRDPHEHLAQDVRITKCIRRANLDSFWASEPRTVSRNLAECKRGVKIASELGFQNKLFRPMGPYPLEDTFGVGAAIVMLSVSTNPGKYDSKVQFSTVRKFRSAFSNAYQASAEGQQAAVMAKDTRKLMVTKCPTYGTWFEKFVRGMHKRMGDIVRPDRALSMDILKEIIKILEDEWNINISERMNIALEASFYLIAFCCALRGEEVPMTDLHGIMKHWEDGSNHPKPHIVVTLVGRFKGETGIGYHVLPVVATTPSGLEPRKWVGRVITFYQIKGIQHGPFFRKRLGQRIRASDMEPKFFERLEQVQELRPDLISENVDIAEEYGIYRSFRRGSTSTVINNGLHKDIVEANNRWRKFEQSGASRPSQSMKDHYTDVTLTLNLLLRYSEAL